jgi:hypothetical protein
MNFRKRAGLYKAFSTLFIFASLWSSFRCLVYCEVYKQKPAPPTHSCCLEKQSSKTPSVISKGLDNCPCDLYSGSSNHESSGTVQDIPALGQRLSTQNLEVMGWLMSDYRITPDRAFFSKTPPVNPIIQVDTYLLTSALLI